MFEAAIPQANAGNVLGILPGIAELLRGEISPQATEALVRGSTALLLLTISYFAAKLFARWVTTAMCRRVDITLGKFLGKLTFYGTLAMALTVILPRVGLEIVGLAAVMAAAGFAMGLAFQGSLSNFAAGILLLVFRPFKVGDLVTAAGITGKVNEIDMFTTIFDTPDNRRVFIPNSAIAGTTIENISFHKQRRVDITVGVSYKASLDETRAVLKASAEALADKMVDGEGRGYQIVLVNLGPSSVEWMVRFWTASENFFAAKEGLTSEIKRQLDAHQIEIPFPQMQLHISETSSVESRQNLAHASLPIPKMASATSATRGNRIRPRVRGDHL